MSRVRPPAARPAGARQPPPGRVSEPAVTVAADRWRAGRWPEATGRATLGRTADQTQTHRLVLPGQTVTRVSDLETSDVVNDGFHGVCVIQLIYV